MAISETNGRGVLLGLACGDALGRPVEFKSSQRIDREHGEVTEMLANGTYGKPAGTITDDTEMALCIACSLTEHGAFEPADVADRFVTWYEHGPFDIGNLTRDVLHELKHGGSWDETGRQIWASLPEGRNAGNGSVMRCAPYAVAFDDSPAVLNEVSRKSSAITHADPRCTYGCAILNLTIAALLHDRQDPLREALEFVREKAPQELLSALEPIADGDHPTSLQSSGYVIHTLQTALYHGLTADTAADAIIAAVNMGDDADTVGAVTGAIAGARFGSDALPNRWLTELDHRDELQSLDSQLASNTFDAPLLSDNT